MKKTKPKKQTKAEPSEADRLREMRTKEVRDAGFVTVNEAAEASLQPRTNIYHWILSGDLAKRTVGAGKGSVFVLLTDLEKKVPGTTARLEKARAA